MTAVLIDEAGSLDSFELVPKQGPEPPENLVLKGAGVRGSAYLGLVKGLEEAGLLAGIKRVAGSSAGGIMALMIGLGMTSEEIQAEMNSINFKQFQDYPNQSWAEFLAIRGGGKAALETFEHAIVAMNSEKRGAYQGDFFMAWAEKIVAKRLGKPNATFRDLHEQIALGDTRLKEMVFTGTVLTGPEAKSLKIFAYEENGQFNDMPIAKAVRITMSFPGAFEMVEHEGQYYADGGIVNNFPMEVFEGERYMAEGSVRTPTGKNPRTLGFRIESWSDFAIQIDILGMAVEFGFIKNREEGFTEATFRKTVEKAFKEGRLTEVEKEALLNRMVSKNVPLKIWTENLVGALKDDRHKASAYPYRAFSIYDQGVATLDFDLSDEKKARLIQGGQVAAQEFVNRFEQEKAIARSDPNEFSQRSENLWHHFFQGMQSQNIETVAIAFHLMQKTLLELEQEKNEIELKLNENPSDILLNNLSDRTQSRIQIAKDWIDRCHGALFSDEAAAFRERYPDLLASENAKQAIFNYKERQAKRFLQQEPEFFRASPTDMKLQLQEKVRLQIEHAERELAASLKALEELSLEMKHIETNQAMLLKRLSGHQFDQESPGLNETFWQALRDMSFIREQEHQVDEQRYRLTPVENPDRWRYLENEKERLREERNKHTDNFLNFLKNTNGLSLEEKEALEILFRKSIEAGWHEPHDLQNLIRNEYAHRQGLALSVRQNQQQLQNQIKEAKKKLNDYSLREERSTFFAELVDLRQSLNKAISDNRWTITDYLRYPFEQFFHAKIFGSLFQRFMGDVSTQKWLKKEEATQLQAIVHATYQAYHEKFDASQADLSILKMLKANVLFAAQNFKNRFIDEFAQVLNANPEPPNLDPLKEKGKNRLHFVHGAESRIPETEELKPKLSPKFREP